MIKEEEFKNPFAVLKKKENLRQIMNFSFCCNISRTPENGFARVCIFFSFLLVSRIREVFLLKKYHFKHEC